MSYFTHPPKTMLELESSWDMLTEEWKNVFAKNLNTDGYITKGDIRALSRLTELDCSESKITDLGPLMYVPLLERLDISGNEIHNFGPIQQLKRLKSVSAVFCNINNTRVFSPLKELEVLDISYNYADEISFAGLRSLKNLKEFYANASPEASLFDLVSLSKLKILALYFSKIKEEEVRLFRMVRPDCYIMF